MSISLHCCKKTESPHSVLNAKHHEKEAEIVAQAGRLGGITIATNMAGRGTDIMLGGNPEMLALKEVGDQGRDSAEFSALFEKYKEQCGKEREQVLQAGGLAIFGTERHESRRIDNQLRGRAGRQGDPGVTRFYISLEDDLMKRFGGDKLHAVINRFGLQPGEPLRGGMMSKAIEKAQTRVEGFHFDIRKHLLEYDDVMNKQRQVIYSDRAKVLARQGVRERILEMIDDLLEEVILGVCDEKLKPEQWEIEQIRERCELLTNAPYNFPDEFTLDPQAIFDVVRKEAKDRYAKQVEEIGSEVLSDIEPQIYLQSLDHFWKLHLLEMDHLKEGINLRGYAQKNPLHEYQREGFLLFQTMLRTMKLDIVRKLYAVKVLTEEERLQIEQQEAQRRAQQQKLMHEQHATPSGQQAEPKEVKAKRSVEDQKERMKAQKKARRRSRR